MDWSHQDPPPGLPAGVDARDAQGVLVGDHNIQTNIFPPPQWEIPRPRQLPAPDNRMTRIPTTPMETGRPSHRRWRRTPTQGDGVRSSWPHVDREKTANSRRWASSAWVRSLLVEAVGG